MIIRKSFKIKLIALAGVLPLLAVLFVPLLNGHTSAVSNGEPKAPFNWQDNDHNKLIDGNNNEYFPLGYACLRSLILTNKDATAIDKAAATTGQTDANKITETDPNSVTVKAGKCDTQVKVASYVWVTKTSPYYVFVVGTSAEKKYDTRFCPVRGSDCTASVRKLKDGIMQGTFLFNNEVGVLTAPGANGPPSTPTAAPGEEVKTAPDCQSQGVSLGFIFCPLIDGLASTIDGLFANLIKPMLVSKPVNIDPKAKCEGSADHGSKDYSGCNYKIWSNFRIYGNIILVMALLVIVFGQSIGGGLVDAYTAKKVLPRLLAAAILINISIYIVAFLVDLTNIVGSGIQTILSKPFVDANAFTLTLNGGTSSTLLLSSILGGAGLVGTIWGLIAAPGVALAIAAPLVQYFALFILLPGLLIFVAILATVIIRQGLIIFLIVVAPIAFALYCLPNTEKYFKKWWELLVKTLLVYPIIALIFTLADILAVTIQQGGGTGGITEWVAQLMSIAALILPLALIPFAFKLAGGFLGQLYNAGDSMRKRSQEAIKGNVNDQNSLRNKTKRNANNAITDRRAGLYNVTRNKRGLKTIGRLAGGGAGIFARQAENLKEHAGRMEVTSSYGNDDYQKAATIPLSQMDEWKKSRSSRYRVKNGVEQWASADGAFYDKDQIKEGHRHYSTESSRQRAFSLALQKAQLGTEEQQNNVLSDYMAYADEAGLDPGTANGRWQGIAIPYKGIRMDLRRAQFEKNTTTGKYEKTGVNHTPFLREFGGATMGELTQQTAGTANALESSIRYALTPSPTRSAAEQAELNVAAAKAYYNLDRFVQGDTGSGASGSVIGAAAAAAAPGGGGTPTSTGATGAYASSSGAAFGNAEAFREAHARLKGDPAISAWMATHRADTIG